MSITSHLPVVGAPAWWVIPEGSIGLTIGELSTLFQHGTLGAGVGSTGLTALFTVTQSSTRPSGAVAGPFATQAQAQAAANAANGRVTGSTQPTAGNIVGGLTGLNAVGDFFHRLTEASTWIRVGEFIAGVVLLYVGARALFPQQVNNIVQPVKNISKKAVRL